MPQSQTKRVSSGAKTTCQHSSTSFRKKRAPGVRVGGLGLGVGRNSPNFKPRTTLKDWKKKINERNVSIMFWLVWKEKSHIFENQLIFFPTSIWESY